MPQNTVKSTSKDNNNNIQSNSIKQNTKNQIITPTTNISQKSLKTLKQASEQNYYVSDSTGSDTNDGLSSATAFKTITKAINSTTNTQTYNIHILTGTYKGVGNTNLTVPGDYTINFIGDGINKTIIDGEVDYTIAGGTVWGSNVYWNAYTIKSGNWGMNITKGNGLIAITGITFQNMVSKGANSINSYKTATIDNYANLKIDHLYFLNNLAGVGAGIRSNNGSILYVNNSIFEGNRKSSSTGNFGAGIYNNGTAVVENSQFIQNAARWGTVTNDKVLSIINCTFENGISYDLASTYKYGSGIASNTGSADYYNGYTIRGLVTNVTNCTFINNGQTDIWQGKGNLLVTGCVFNKSTGIYLNAGSRNETLTNLIVNNTFTDLMPSSYFGSLSVITGTTFGIYSQSQYNTTIENNTISLENNGYGIYSSGNILIKNNTLNKYVYITSQNNTICNNTINTTDDYAVYLDTNAKNNDIINNTLESNLLYGDNAVTNVTGNNIENNLPNRGKNIIITDITYSTYFNNDGTIKTGTIESGSTLYLSGAIYNKNFTISNIKVLFKNYDNSILYNGSIVIKDFGRASIDGIVINNTNNNEYVVLLESKNNKLINSNIFVNTISKIHTIIIKNDYNVLDSSEIITNGPSNNIKYDNNYGICDTIGVLIESSHNKITKNTINTTYTTTNNDYGTITGVSIQTPINYTEDNYIYINKINVISDKYGYGLNIINSNNNNVEMNWYDINSNYYANAIQLIGDVSNNLIRGYITIDSKVYGYGAILNGYTLANNNSIAKLYIQNITASNIFGVILCNTNNTNVSDASYTLYSDNFKAIDLNNANNTLIKLTIKSNTKTNTSSAININNSNNVTIESTQITLNKGTGITINNSTNITYGTYATQTFKTQSVMTTNDTGMIIINSNNILVNDTIIKTTSEYTIMLNNTNNSMIIYNYLNANNTLGGNIAVKEINSKNNIIENNTPNIIVITNDNYNKYFTNSTFNIIENGIIVTIGSNIYNKNMIFLNSLAIINQNNYTVYNGTIVLNGSSSTIDNLICNSTNGIESLIYINASSCSITNCTLYQENNNTNAYTIQLAKGVKYNSIVNCNIITKGPEIKNNGIPSTSGIYDISNKNVNYIYTSKINVTYTSSDKQGIISGIYTNNTSKNVWTTQKSNDIIVKGDNQAVGIYGTANDVEKSNITVASNNKAIGLIINNELTSGNLENSYMNITAGNTAIGFIIQNTTKYYSIYKNNIYLNSKNQTIFADINNETSTSAISTNNIVQLSTNIITIRINNTFPSISNNNIDLTGDNIHAILISNFTTKATKQIINNNITVTTSNPTTAIKLDNLNNIKINSNQIIIKGNYTANKTPIITLTNCTNANTTNNYLQSRDLQGNDAVETTDNKNIIENNTPTTTEYKTQIITNIPKNMTLTQTYPIKINITDMIGESINTGTINITIDNKELEIINMPQTTYKYTPTTLGEHTITVTYTDTSGKYLTTTNTYTMNVEKMNTNLNIIVTPGSVITNTTFNITATDNNGNTIKSGNVTLTLQNGTVLGIVDLSNPTNVSYFITPTGTYTVNVVYNDLSNTYKDTNITTSVTIGKNNDNSLVITTTPGTTTKDTIFNITAYDQNKNILKTGTVTLVLTNGTTIGTVDLSKNSTINYLFINSGNYTVVATYTDPSNVYGNVVDIFQVNIKDQTVNMNAIVIPGTTTTNTTFNVKLTDDSNNTVTTGTVYFYNNNTLIGTVNVTSSTPTFNYVFKDAGVYNITVKYNNITKTLNFTVNKTNTQIAVNPITGIATNNITLQANITDINGNKINEGTVTFRINGSTLKDAKGNMIYVNVTNGNALLNYTIPGSWAKNNLTIQAIYHPTSTYNPSQNISTVNVTKTTPNVKIINGNINTVYNSTTPISVQVTDNDGNIIQSGKIALKLNGKTIGHANVINGIANYNYTTQNSARTYKLTVVYGSSNYNRAETNTNFTVQKQNTTITTNPITTTTGNTITITGLIKNNDQNPIDRNTKIAIKIDGKTIGHTTSNNGLINYNYTIPTNYKNPTHTITIISGANNFYNGNTTSTTLTINKV